MKEKLTHTQQTLTHLVTQVIAWGYEDEVHDELKQKGLFGDFQRVVDSMNHLLEKL